MFYDALDGSLETNSNLNIANPKYAAKLREIKLAELNVKRDIAGILPETLSIEDLSESLKPF